MSIAANLTPCTMQMLCTPRPVRIAFSARMPWAFTAHSMKVSSLDKKLTLPRDTAILIRERVASLNGCLFCQDASRYYALQKGLQAEDKLDALPDYASSPLFNDAERAALVSPSELTNSKRVSPETFARLRSFYSRRERSARSPG